MNTATATKPAYRIPSMAECQAASGSNGMTAASTFAGCGGSGLGVEMAGFGVRWANEFTPDAQKCHKAAFPDCLIDGRSIRDVKGSEVLAALGLDAGELDLFEGSPPCVSFSTAGKRDKDWGKQKAYHGTAQRCDDLFLDFARLLGELQPRTFFAENVSGLAKGKAKGWFKIILRDLKSKGYRVRAAMLDAKWLGVPQSRQRVFYVGVRNDLGVEPPMPTPTPWFYSVADACPWLVAGRFGAKGWQSLADRPSATVSVHLAWNPETNSQGMELVEMIVGNDRFKPRWGSTEQESPTIVGSPCGTSGQVREAGRRRKLTIAELKRICGFPDDFPLLGSYAKQWARLGLSVPPPMSFRVAERLRDDVLVPLGFGQRCGFAWSDESGWEMADA